LRRFVAALLFATAAVPLAAADMSKTLRLAFQLAESGFDPAIFQDVYSGMLSTNILDPLVDYDYLARPAKLKPNTAEALPEVSSDGLTYTFRVKPGIYFTPDPAFRDKRRELVAADYAFVIKRLFDPKVKSPNLYLLEGKIVGLDALMERSRKLGRFDYDAPVEGCRRRTSYPPPTAADPPHVAWITTYPILDRHSSMFGRRARDCVGAREPYGDDIGIAWSHGGGMARCTHCCRGSIQVEAKNLWRRTRAPRRHRSHDAAISIWRTKRPLAATSRAHVV
jgi:ABC-type transport system substrate-binding protein